MPRWRFSSIIHPLSSTRQWALGQAPGACEKKRGGDQHNIAASLHACLRAFFACSPSLHFYRRLCYAFWIKAVSTLITLLKEYTFCNHGRQSVLVLSHNFQVHYLPPPLPLSLSLSRLHYRFFLCFFLLVSSCELEKEAFFCVPFISIGTEKDFFNFKKKKTLGFRWAWIVDLLLEVSGIDHIYVM